MSVAEVMDTAKSQAFAESLVEILNHSGLALMLSLGHRTGLLDTLARLETATCEQLARESQLSERYVREWLGAMVTGGVVEYVAEAAAYRLPAEHAAWLTRSASPNNIAASMQWLGVLGSVEDRVCEAFRHGQGVPYSAYNRFHEVMAEESAQTVFAGLCDHILPLVPGLVDRLQQGIEVLDVGCGAGRAMIFLAGRFPQSRFVGRDFSAEAIGQAQREAASLGLTNVTFEPVDAAEMNDVERFHLITAFDAIHDQVRPQQVLDRVHRALKPHGVFLMQDIAGSGHAHTDSRYPLATFGYAISCMHCMSVSLAGGGPGLGAMWGKQKAHDMLAQAGFQDVRRESLEHDMLNYYYICTP
jgi:ubiquinone/menaquinone biosynthesis C-methylase UbiE